MSWNRAIHQIWLGPKPIPERERQWCADMARINPTWKHTLHNNELLTRYATDPYIKTMQERNAPIAFQTDRLRILLLRDEGGVYLDADCQPIKPLDSLPIWDRPELDFVAGMRSPHRNNVALHRAVPLVDNTFFGSRKGGTMVSRIASLWSPAHVVIDGHAQGTCVIENADPGTLLLGQRYFYAMEQFPESIVLHDATNLGSWSATKNFLSPTHATV